VGYFRVQHFFSFLLLVDEFFERWRPVKLYSFLGNDGRWGVLVTSFWPSHQLLDALIGGKKRNGAFGDVAACHDTHFSRNLLGEAWGIFSLFFLFLVRIDTLVVFTLIYISLQVYGLLITCFVDVLYIYIYIYILEILFVCMFPKWDSVHTRES
jgi:hypothetical protein